MASRNGSASAGSCMAVTETSPSILDPMCGKMRGHSDMLHPHRIAVKLGRSKGMPLPGHCRALRGRIELILYSCSPVHQPAAALMGAKQPTVRVPVSSGIAAGRSLSPLVRRSSARRC